MELAVDEFSFFDASVLPIFGSNSSKLSSIWYIFYSSSSYLIISATPLIFMKSCADFIVFLIFIITFLNITSRYLNPGLKSTFWNKIRWRDISDLFLKELLVHLHNFTLATYSLDSVFVRFRISANLSIWACWACIQKTARTILNLAVPRQRMFLFL